MNMENIQKRIEIQIEDLKQFTSTPDKGVTRLTYSDEDLQARNYIKNKMREYGLKIKEDGFGNIFGKLDGMIKDAPSVLIGSHFDSVPNGGAYDGTAGVVVALEVAALFVKNNVKPNYPLEIVALVEEEGSRFPGGLMGSRGMIGLLTEEEFKNLKDKSGISTMEAMKKIGLDPTLNKVRDSKTMKAFLELHIEQGPILEEKQIPVGIVEKIVGITQLEVTIKGQAGHAGTTPMNGRADALVAAAQIIAQLPDLAKQEGEGSVITTGRLNVFPNGANVIPEKVVFTVDIRSGREEDVLSMVQKTKDIVNTYNDHNMNASVTQLMYMQPKELNQDIRSLLKEVCHTLHIQSCAINSGAGHDAMVLSNVTDVGMIFIPSQDGLSHCPEEWSDAKHLADGVNVLYETARKLTAAN